MCSLLRGIAVKRSSAPTSVLSWTVITEIIFNTRVQVNDLAVRNSELRDVRTAYLIMAAG
jgi:hypothetical protein